MTNRFGFPNLGFGMGLRTTHYPHILEHWPKMDWFEIISENYMDTGGRPVRVLEQVLEHYPVVMHGVSLSIGSTDPLNKEYLTKLKNLAEWVKPPWISDHLCWTGIEHKNTHDLLPVPYTEEALTHIVDRIKQVQDFLGRPFVLENPSTYMEFRDSTIPEWEFIARMVEEADCGLLLDANNVYVSCYNHRWDTKTYIDAIPAGRVVQIHLAGHTNKGTHIVDTHMGEVIDEVWRIYRYILSRTGPVSTMVEWDDEIPEFDVVAAEVEKARAFAEKLEVPNDIPSYLQPPLANDNEKAPDPYPAELGMFQGAVLAGDAAVARAAEWIPAKQDFPPEAQLDVYIKAYRYRLFDVVSEDFPALRYYLGDALMNELLDAYIEATPSLSFNIAHYMQKLADFTKEYFKEKGEFAAELCVLESALTTLFDAEETPALEQADLAEVDPESFFEMQLQPRVAFGLYHFEYPVNTFFQAFKDEEEPDEPGPQESWLAVVRHNDTMWRADLEEQEYKLLSLLAEGKPIGEAIEALVEEGIDDEEQLIATFQQWFTKWMQGGFFRKLEAN